MSRNELRQQEDIAHFKLFPLSAINYCEAEYNTETSNTKTSKLKFSIKKMVAYSRIIAA